jgi:hypothetical protein
LGNSDQWLFIPSNEQAKTLCKKQSRYRKNVEYAFVILQAKYEIMKGLARLWSQEYLKYIVDCVIILHNMGILYEQGMEELSIDDYENATRGNLDNDRDVTAF